jgi:hypothetical protein
LACQSVQVKSADLVIALLLAQTNKYEIFSGYLGAANLKQKCANLSKHNVPTKTAQQISTA